MISGINNMNSAYPHSMPIAQVHDTVTKNISKEISEMPTKTNEKAQFEQRQSTMKISEAAKSGQMRANANAVRFNEPSFVAYA